MNQIIAWLAQNNIRLPILVATVALLLAAAVTILLLNRVLRHLLRRLEHRFRLPYETVLLITRIVTGSLWVIAVLLILELWGVSIGGLWTILASAATVIGVGFLAVWTMISNITASFFIALWRPFHFGQTVELLPENLKGRVIERNMMFTILREEHGSVLQIPNNLFFQKMFRVSGEDEQYLFEFLEDQRAPAARVAAREREPARVEARR
jgi:small-conductance mechanosensitive channel